VAGTPVVADKILTIGHLLRNIFIAVLNDNTFVAATDGTALQVIGGGV